MIRSTRFAAIAGCAALALTAPVAAHAAASYDGCTGYIDALPAVLSTAGTWCLRKDLATALNTGDVVDIEANNVTIDCNGFRIGNLSAPPPRGATGIASYNRRNVVVRNCSLRGFFAGVYLFGGFGHVVEDNLVEGAHWSGINTNSEQVLIRRNRVFDTGIDEDAGQGSAYGIISQGGQSVVADNVVMGVFGTTDAESQATGIFFNGFAHRIIGNVVNGVEPGGGETRGIKSNTSSASVIEGNMVVQTAGPGVGVDVTTGTARPVCRNNQVRGFTTSAYDTCIDAGGNYSD